MESRGTDEGVRAYPDYNPALSAHTAPMMVVNGYLTASPRRHAPTTDVDRSPQSHRRYVNVGQADVQLHNGLRWKTGTGFRWPYRGSDYLYNSVPFIPGQTRDNVAGFHKRGPSPYNVQDVIDNGPGSQPEHPGGPGKIAAPSFYNPMTG